MSKLGSLFCMTFLSICLYAQNNGGSTSPEILPDNSVIFRLKAPEASSVQVVGTWARDFKPVPMVRNDSSVYEVKIGPLPSDMYEYRFILDGVAILDPGNNAVTRDGVYVENRLLVPGKLADLIAVQDVPHGKVSAVWYQSPTLGTQRRMYVYTPPGYEQGKAKYPVMYLLHGGGGDEDGWVNRGRVNYIIDNLIASKQSVPMIVVVTNGNPDAVAAPLDRPSDKNSNDARGIAAMASMRFEQSFVQDVVPYIEKNYRVIADADHRALTGFSMGGYQTQNITNNNPGMFNYIAVMSMGLFSSFRNANVAYDREKHVAQLKTLMASQPKFYWIGIGKDDFLFETVTKLRTLYDEIGVKYTYRESEGSHTWKEWRLYLTELAPKFFK